MTRGAGARAPAPRKTIVVGSGRLVSVSPSCSKSLFVQGARAHPRVVGKKPGDVLADIGTRASIPALWQQPFVTVGLQPERRSYRRMETARRLTGQAQVGAQLVWIADTLSAKQTMAPGKPRKNGVFCGWHSRCLTVFRTRRTSASPLPVEGRVGKQVKASPLREGFRRRRERLNKLL